MITKEKVLLDEGRTLIEVYRFKLSRYKAFYLVLEQYLSETTEGDVKELIQNRLAENKRNVNETEQMLKITELALSLLPNCEGEK